ncbi:MAG: AMP-binding protein, partial [Myxococcota bacterium]
MSLLHRWRAGWTEPDKLAIRTPRHTLTYDDLDGAIRRAVGWLKAHDLGKGDILALQTEKTPAFLVLHLAALSQGVITLPLNDRYTPAEVGFMVEDAGAKRAILVRPAPVSCPTIDAHDLGPQLNRAEAVDIGDGVDLESIGVICYTSGTTGKPKGA